MYVYMYVYMYVCMRVCMFEYDPLNTRYTGREPPSYIHIHTYESTQMAETHDFYIYTYATIPIHTYIYTDIPE